MFLLTLFAKFDYITVAKLAKVAEKAVFRNFVLVRATTFEQKVVETWL